jgi:transmembrane sensor
MDDLLLQKYLRNETSEEELAEVLDWLDASTENQRYLDRLDYISNLNILAGEAQPRFFRRRIAV